MKRFIFVLSGGIAGVALILLLVNSNSSVEQTFGYEENKTELSTDPAVLVTGAVTHKDTTTTTSSVDTVHKLPQVPAESDWKNRLCKIDDDGCELHLDQDWQTTLTNQRLTA